MGACNRDPAIAVSVTFRHTGLKWGTDHLFSLLHPVVKSDGPDTVISLLTPFYKAL